MKIFQWKNNMNNCKSEFACGFYDVESEFIPCYDLSEKKGQICNRIHDANAISVFDHFSENTILKIAFEKILILVLVCSILISVGASYVIKTNADHVLKNNNKDS